LLRATNEPYKEKKGAAASMIVTCPECSTRYLVDPRNLGATGKMVRCASCAHTWYQTPPDDAPQRVDVPPLELAEAAAVGSNTGLRAEGRVQLPALSTPRRGSSVLGWLAYTLLMLVVIAAGAYLTRTQLVSRWPELAQYYEMLGVPVENSQAGSFDFHNVTTTRDTENGLPALIIQGEVVNVSNVAKQVPKLKVTLLDNAKHELQSWSFTVSDDRMLPGASVAFRTSIARHNEEATMALVTVADGG
jgi:predicted Zn finger-like uncharacterized protein